MASLRYKRVLLKLSGEALMGDDPYGINRGTIERMVADVAEVAKMGVELAIVIGGGHNGLVAAYYLAKAGLKPRARIRAMGDDEALGQRVHRQVLDWCAAHPVPKRHIGSGSVSLW